MVMAVLSDFVMVALKFTVGKVEEENVLLLKLLTSSLHFQAPTNLSAGYTQLPSSEFACLL
jgi:hypothetical protein